MYRWIRKVTLLLIWQAFEYHTASPLFTFFLFIQSTQTSFWPLYIKNIFFCSRYFHYSKWFFSSLIFQVNHSLFVLNLPHQPAKRRLRILSVLGFCFQTATLLILNSLSFCIKLSYYYNLPVDNFKIYLS